MLLLAGIFVLIFAMLLLAGIFVLIFAMLLLAIIFVFIFGMLLAAGILAVPPIMPLVSAMLDLGEGVPVELPGLP